MNFKISFIIFLFVIPIFYFNQIFYTEKVINRNKKIISNKYNEWEYIKGIQKNNRTCFYYNSIDKIIGEYKIKNLIKAYINKNNELSYNNRILDLKKINYNKRVLKVNANNKNLDLKETLYLDDKKIKEYYFKKY